MRGKINAWNIFYFLEPPQSDQAKKPHGKPLAQGDPAGAGKGENAVDQAFHVLSEEVNTSSAGGKRETAGPGHRREGPVGENRGLERESETFHVKKGGKEEKMRQRSRNIIKTIEA